MPLAEFAWALSELRKKLFYVAAVFGAGAMISFSLMGEVIKKMQYDLFYRFNLSDKSDAAVQLTGISNNLSALSREFTANNSAVAQNLTRLSGEILNISQSLAPNGPNIVYLSPLEVLMLKFKMSLIAGALIAAPLILYYIYKGIKGRLKSVVQVTNSLIISTAVAGIALFLLGAYFAYYLMLPTFLGYIYRDAAEAGVIANFSVYEFVYFVGLTTVVIGLSFELPLVLIFLVRFGITSRQTLAHYRRHAYIILLIIAAVVTPDPTMFSQIMVSVPFIVLYEASLLAMRLTGK